MTTAFFLGQNVNLTNELGVGLDGAGSGKNLSTLNLALGDTTKEGTNIVACFSVLEDLVEHFCTGNGGFLGFLQTNDLDFLAELVEMEIRDLLSSYEFPGDDIPIVKGSAVKALEGDPEAKKAILELMDAVDAYIPTPERPVDKPFLMPVEDVFSISGRGTVATGRIERGIIKKMEEVEIVGIKPTVKTAVTDIEMFRKLLDSGEAGDNVGVLLRGIKKEDIVRGQVIAKPGSVTPHTDFDAAVYVLTKEEGGRHTPFFNNYRPQFYFRTTDVTGTVTLQEGTEMVMPGDNVTISVELITPVAMEEGMRFAIREGGRTVGAGKVAKIKA